MYGTGTKHIICRNQKSGVHMQVCLYTEIRESIQKEPTRVYNWNFTLT